MTAWATATWLDIRHALARLLAYLRWQPVPAKGHGDGAVATWQDGGVAFRRERRWWAWARGIVRRVI